jgi:hypothetical protein
MPLFMLLKDQGTDRHPTFRSLTITLSCAIRRKAISWVNKCKRSDYICWMNRPSVALGSAVAVICRRFDYLME